MSDVGLHCISPVRPFNISLTIEHARGHVICFPSDGHKECSKSLPYTEPDVSPLLTFIGTKEKRRVDQNRFKKFYSLPHEDLFQWLEVLKLINSEFQDLDVERTRTKIESLSKLVDAIEANMVYTDETKISEIMNCSQFTTDQEDLPICVAGRIICSS